MHLEKLKNWTNKRDYIKQYPRDRYIHIHIRIRMYMHSEREVSMTIIVS